MLVRTATVTAQGALRVDPSTRSGDFYLATTGDLELATSGDFLMATDNRWTTRRQLALAVFDWIEAWYNPRRRHSYCAMLSPADYEAAHAA